MTENEVNLLSEGTKLKSPDGYFSTFLYFNFTDCAWLKPQGDGLLFVTRKELQLYTRIEEISR